MQDLSINAAADLALTDAERRRAGLERRGPLWLDAVLRPHRSLTRRGFAVLCAAAGAVSLLAMLRFWMLGAWPVAVIFLVDAILLYGAFRLSYARGRSFEVIQLNDTALIVTRVGWTGRVTSWAFNPDWVRVELAGGRGGGHPELILFERDQKAVLGHFLPPGEREDVANALKEALARRKAGAPPIAKR